MKLLEEMLFGMRAHLLMSREGKSLEKQIFLGFYDIIVILRGWKIDIEHQERNIINALSLPKKKKSRNGVSSNYLVNNKFP